MDFRSTFTAVALTTVALTAPAQEPAPPPPPTPMAAVAMGEVTARAEQLSARLEAIAAYLAANPVADIAVDVDRFTARLAERAEPLQRVQLERLRQSERMELQQEWQSYRDRLNGRERELLEISQSLDESRQNLETAASLWETSLEKAEADGAPPAVIGRIRKALDDLTGARQQVTAARDQALTTLDRVTTVRLQVDRVLDRLEKAARGVWAQALRLDSPPLWTAVARRLRSGEAEEPRPGEGEATPGAEERPALARFDDTWSRIRGYADREQERFALVLLLFAGLTFALVLARRRLTRGEVEEALRPQVAAIAERPFAGSTLATLLLANWLLPGRPAAVNELLVVLLLAAWWRLVPAAVAPPLQRPFYELAALFLVEHYARTLIVDTLWLRLAVLGIAVAGAVIGVRALRRGGALRSVTVRGLGRAFRGLVPVAVVVLAAAAIASVVGAVRLAEAMTRGVITSAALAALLHPTVLTFGVLVLLFMRRSTPWLLRVVRDNAAKVEGWLLGLLTFGGVLLWLDFTLTMFGIRDLLAGRLAGVVTATWTVGEAEISLGKVLTLVLVFVGTLLVSRFVRGLLVHDVYPRVNLPRGVPNAVSTLVKYAFVALALLLAPLAAGVDFSNLAFIAGGLGVGIGFGLQNVVANFVSGLILAFERPVQIGDTVNVGQHLGTVSTIGIRSSTIRTFDGADVVVPNSQLVSQVVVNWTLSDFQRRMQLDLKVAYGANPQRVLEILRDAAGAHDDVLDQPKPLALFRGFEETGLAFRLLFWIPTRVALTAPSEIGLAIFDAFEREGIEMPIPRQRLVLEGRAEGTVDQPTPSE